MFFPGHAHSGCLNYSNGILRVNSVFQTDTFIFCFSESTFTSLPPCLSSCQHPAHHPWNGLNHHFMLNFSPPDIHHLYLKKKNHLVLTSLTYVGVRLYNGIPLFVQVKPPVFTYHFVLLVLKIPSLCF